MKNCFVTTWYLSNRYWTRETAYFTDNHDGTWHLHYESSGDGYGTYDEDGTAEVFEEALNSLRERYKASRCPLESNFKYVEVTAENLDEITADLRKGYDKYVDFIGSYSKLEQVRKRNTEILTLICRLEIAVKFEEVA